MSFFSNINNKSISRIFLVHDDQLMTKCTKQNTECNTVTNILYVTYSIYIFKYCNCIIPIYQISMPTLAPSSHSEFSESILELNVMRAPEVASIFNIWGL